MLVSGPSRPQTPTPDRTALPGVGSVVSSPLDALARIAEPAVDLVVWSRQLPHGLSEWLESLPIDALPTARLALPVGKMAEPLAAAFDRSGTPATPQRAASVGDLLMLGRRFAALHDATIVDLRLEIVFNDSCLKFHRDCVRARLLTTYRGPSTQWVAPEYAEHALVDPVGWPGPIEHLPRHAVALFKGCMHEQRGTVHRSPPIAGTGTTRLLLCLNLLPEAPRFSGTAESHDAT